ncbi:Scr1 family TA system antitoxin-like transcriptional regulator [Streptomyces sp. NPDC059477]|uniref:helix-turn-helix domain-containing protein n=1 Tax=Streptomyces sp. NPDC059477 TaxID=3346847 RepID=UPI0036949F77
MAALFGTRVRRLRKAAGLTQAELGDLVHVVATRITQIERASGSKPTLELARALDAALGADNLLIDLWIYVYREAFPDWSQKFITEQRRAVVIREYAAHLVPGLLQTEKYARAVLSLGQTLTGKEHLEERVTFRMERQGRLAGPDRPDYWVILDEAVLRRPVGGQAVMRDQMARLLKAAEESHVTIQVLPFVLGGHDFLNGSLSLLIMPDGSEIAYTEGSHHGQLSEEPDEIRGFALAYDRLRAAALPPLMSLEMIRSLMEVNHRGTKVPSPSDRRRLAKEQLHQSGRRQLRGGGRRAQKPPPGQPSSAS